MIIEIKINARHTKYGDDLASTELSLDTDAVDELAVVELAKGMTLSAIKRAQNKQADREEKKVEPVATVTIDKAIESTAF